MSWRTEANKAIVAALKNGQAKGLSGPDLEKYVRAEGYPFGERAMHPYKIWCNEVKRVLKTIPSKPLTARSPDLPGQGKLF